MFPLSAIQIFHTFHLLFRNQNTNKALWIATLHAVTNSMLLSLSASIFDSEMERMAGLLLLVCHVNLQRGERLRLPRL